MWIFEMDVVVRPRGLENIFRANLHTLPAPPTPPAQEMNVLRFKPMVKREIIHI